MFELNELKYEFLEHPLYSTELAPSAYSQKVEVIVGKNALVFRYLKSHRLSRLKKSGMGRRNACYRQFCRRKKSFTQWLVSKLENNICSHVYTVIWLYNELIFMIFIEILTHGGSFIMK